MGIVKKQNDFARKFENSIDLFCKRFQIDKDCNVIVAFSGGADSLALLVALTRIGFEKITAIYVNHHLRSKKELDEEIKLNSKNAKALGVEFIILDADAKKIDRLKSTLGLEGAARIVRYELLYDFAAKNNCHYILTAHNSTDCDEGDIIQFFRGADDFNSIPEKNDIIYRPLLNFSHADNEKYCRECGFDYSQDTTNFDDEHLRSRIRINLIGIIEKIFPSFQNSFKVRRKILKQQESLKSELFTALRAVNVHNSNNSRVGLKDISSILDFFENGNNTGKLEYCDAVVFRARKADYILEKKDSLNFKWSTDVSNKDIESGCVELDNFEKYNILKLSDDNKIVRFDCMANNVLCLSWNKRAVFRSYSEDDFLLLDGKKHYIKSLLKSASINSNIANMIPVLEIDGAVCALLLGSAGFKNKFSDEYKLFLQSNNCQKYVFIRSSGLLF